VFSPPDPSPHSNTDGLAASGPYGAAAMGDMSSAEADLATRHVDFFLDAIVSSFEALLLALMPPPAISKPIYGTDMQIFEAAAKEVADGTEGDTTTHNPSADSPTAAEDPIFFRVLVQEGVSVDARGFALSVALTLADERGWAAAGRPFRLGHGSRGTVDIILARPNTVDRLCRPLRTGGYYSCGRSGHAVINDERWRHGAAAYTGSLADYQTYVINHEVGHLLAMPHLPCPRRGDAAPVMQQQSKTLAGCTPTSLPSERELTRLRRRSRWRASAANRHE
jgi:hypothetical protein